MNSPTERPLCEATNRRGQPCRNPSEPGSHFCRWHQDPENPAKTDPRSWRVRAAKILREREV